MKRQGGPVFDLAGEVCGWEHGRKPVAIRMAPRAQVVPIVEANHYSHKAQKNAFCHMVVTYAEHGVQGAIQIGRGIRPGTDKGLVEFERMWLSDLMPKYSETIVLGLVHRFMRHRFPEVHTLRSWCDTSVGNPGTIYRAANYTETKRVPADFYILPGGERVHPVSMWHRHGTRAKAFLDQRYPGWSKAKGEQIQFEYYLAKRGR